MIWLRSFALMPSMSRCSSALISVVSLVFSIVVSPRYAFELPAQSLAIVVKGLTIVPTMATRSAMQKRSRMPRDFNELAHKTLQIAICEDVEPEPEPKKPKLSLAHQPSARRDY